MHTLYTLHKNIVMLLLLPRYVGIMDTWYTLHMYIVILLLLQRNIGILQTWYKPNNTPQVYWDNAILSTHFTTLRYIGTMYTLYTLQKYIVILLLLPRYIGIIHTWCTLQNRNNVY